MCAPSTVASTPAPSPTGRDSSTQWSGTSRGVPSAPQTTFWATAVWPGPVVSVPNGPVTDGTNHSVDRGAYAVSDRPGRSSRSARSVSAAYDRSRPPPRPQAANCRGLAVSHTPVSASRDSTVASSRAVTRCPRQVGAPSVPVM